MAMIKKINTFLVGYFARQLVDVISTIDENAGLALHVANAGGCGNDAIETFTDIRIHNNTGEEG